MRLSLLFLTLLFSANLFSQESKFILKFSPLALIDEPSFATIQAGIEIKLSKRLSWYNEFGIGYKRGYYEKVDTSFISSSPRYKIKTELRYYCRPWRTKRKLYGYDMEGIYFAVNLYYVKDRHNTAISYYHQNDSSLEKIDNFAVKKDAGGFNILVGHQRFLTKKLMLDLYAGLGPRWRHVETFNKEFEDKQDQLIIPIDVNINGIRNITDATGGSSIVPNFTMGLRICYRL